MLVTYLYKKDNNVHGGCLKVDNLSLIYSKLSMLVLNRGGDYKKMFWYTDNTLIDNDFSKVANHLIKIL